MLLSIEIWEEKARIPKGTRTEAVSLVKELSITSVKQLRTKMLTAET